LVKSRKRRERQKWIVRRDDLIGEFDVNYGEMVPGVLSPQPRLRRGE
jgi:hypothetical protein